MSARAWGAFLSASILWGIPHFFIKVAVDDGGRPPTRAAAEKVPAQA